MEGNQMKMRNVLRAWLKAYDEFVQKPNENGEYPKFPCGTLVIPTLRAAFLVDETNKVLSTPVRNCDVGTAEEQSNRRRKFCAKQKRNGIINCGYCPIKHQYQRDCTLAWAQMPYEEGGAK